MIYRLAAPNMTMDSRISQQRRQVCANRVCKSAYTLLIGRGLGGDPAAILSRGRDTGHQAGVPAKPSIPEGVRGTYAAARNGHFGGRSSTSTALHQNKHHEPNPRRGKQSPFHAARPLLNLCGGPR